MNEDFEIEIQGNETETPGSGRLPANILPVGTIENDDVKVYIKQQVFSALQKYAKEDTAHERGTILLGQAYEELGKTHVIVSDYIEARYTDASAATLTFTHETWDYIHKEHDQKHPNEKIIGWQHTHPSYGIFLSNYDLFIHENFFNLPFQIAYVIDPVQDISGLFQWKNGKIEKLGGYYLYDDVGKPIKTASVGSKAKPENTNRKRNGLPIILSTLALLLVCVSLFQVLRTSKNLKTLKVQLNESIEQREELDTSIKKLNDDMRFLLERDGSGQAQSEESIAEQFSAFSQRIEEQQGVIEAQQMRINELETTVDALRAEQESEEKKEDIVHIVRLGDTLGSICSSYGVNYAAHRDAILRLNSIKDENIIVVGQTIKLPAEFVENN